MPRKKTEWLWKNERTCAKCGKVFLAAPEHIYKTSKSKMLKWYCSWTCYIHNDDKRKGKNYEQ